MACTDGEAGCWLCRRVGAACNRVDARVRTCSMYMYRYTLVSRMFHGEAQFKGVSMWCYLA